MSIAIITGSGTNSLPGFEHGAPESVDTPFGQTSVSRGLLGDIEALHVSRHGSGHVRLSHQVTHRANIWALHSIGVRAIVAPC